MIGYVTLGTNNLKKATAFYGELLAELAAGRFIGCFCQKPIFQRSTSARHLFSKCFLDRY